MCACGICSQLVRVRARSAPPTVVELCHRLLSFCGILWILAPKRTICSIVGQLQQAFGGTTNRWLWFTQTHTHTYMWHIVTQQWQQQQQVRQNKHKTVEIVEAASNSVAKQPKKSCNQKNFNNFSWARSTPPRHTRAAAMPVPRQQCHPLHIFLYTHVFFVLATLAAAVPQRRKGRNLSIAAMMHAS